MVGRCWVSPASVTPWSRLLGWPLGPHGVLAPPLVASQSHGKHIAMWSLCSWCTISLLTPPVVATVAKATPGLAPWLIVIIAVA